MKTKDFRVHALETLKANPGLTRTEWFNACMTNGGNDKPHKSLWHTFKFQVALVLILGGHVRAEENPNDRGLDLFFPVGG